MANNEDSFTKHKKQTYDFIIEDRNVTKEVLLTVLEDIKKTNEVTNHGMVAAKLIETLQRSAEQLVKLVAIEQKDALKVPKEEEEELSEEEKKQLYGRLNVVK